LAILFLLWLVSVPLEGADNPWVAMTKQDLQAIHDLLQENHPGPVDPENLRYAKWLKDGLDLSIQRAESAACFSDYVRELKFYTNGFQDGHIGIGLEVEPKEIVWPGFIIDRAQDNKAEVVAAEPDSGVENGATILSCDGKTIDTLMAERVDPYFWNSAIPHERFLHLYRLFYQDALDSRSRFRNCKFSTGEKELRWRKEDTGAFQKRLDSARGVGSREPSLKKIHGVWLIKVPTLAYTGAERVRQIRKLIAEIKSHASELRTSTVIFDVRGNHGGDSAWGEELVSALWGKDWVKWITGKFDETTDWRASPSNYEFIESMIQREKTAGLDEQVEYLNRVRDAMKDALDSGGALARVDDRPKPQTETPPQNRVTGKVFFFTDNVCASACLDLADLMVRLPHVQHVGLPTSADAIYIDNTYSTFSSGLAGLGYSMKVFRNRVRGNNEWYTPKIPWPGGEMTDESIAIWIASISKGTAKQAN
jgi:hypothetical protein